MYLFYLNIPELRWVGIVAAHTAAAIPLVSRSVNIGFTRISEELLETAEIFNVRGLYRLVKVILPLMREPIIIAASLSIVVSLGEFGATLLLHNSQTTTLSVAIYKLRAARRFLAASAEATILMAITIALLYYISRRSGRWL
jgi:ABC-type Fe3+ transport system permease subunit